MVDTAHGSEMAHDPRGQFGKTVLGQIACLDHVIDLAQQGFITSGIMIEASDYEHPDPFRQTDPNMPFFHALNGVQELHKIIINS